MFTGDTQPCQTVVELAHGADMLLCMCWDDQDRMETAGKLPGSAVPKALPRWHRRLGSSGWYWSM